MEQTRDIILFARTDGKIVDANRAATEASGYSVKEMQQLSLGDLLVSEELKPVIEQLFEAAKSGTLLRMAYKRKNGDLLPVETRPLLLREDVLVCIIRDISEQVAYENVMRQTEQKLLSLNEKLAAAYVELAASEHMLRQQYEALMVREAAIYRQSMILESVHNMAIGLMNQYDPEKVLQMIVAGATKLVGTPHGFIYRLDKDRGVFYRSHGLGIYEKDIGREIPINEGVVGAVYRTGKPYIANNYNKWRRHSKVLPQFPEITAVMEIPLKSAGQVIGTIGLGYEQKTFRRHEVETLRRFADMASVALDNAILVTSYEQELRERREAEAALRASEDTYRTIFEAGSDGIIIHDLQTGQIVDLNKQACKLLGYSREELLGNNVAFLGTGVPPYSEEDARAWLRRAADGDSPRFEWQHIRGDGRVIWLEINLSRVQIGRQVRILAVARDITERKRQEQQIVWLAYHDALTGLYNRAYFQKRLNEELFKAKCGVTAGAVLFIDIDDLKFVNDSLGHSCGDEIIRFVSECLIAATPEDAVVARVGGDEFVILLPNEANRTRVEAVAARIQKNLAESCPIRDYKHPLSVSMGIALYPIDGNSMDEIYRKADIALYVAKEKDKNNWCFYEPALGAATHEKMALQRDLYEALERQELAVFYQPIAEVRTGRINRFEALLRWESPKYGLVLPSRFIWLAEENNLLIKKIGKWVLEEACKFAGKLATAGYADVQVGVNVSPRQLLADDFIDVVCQVIRDTGIEPRQLRLEITENVFIRQMESCKQKLAKLKEYGVGLSLDDFGRGYSSLTYLRILPVDALKLDKSFIEPMLVDERQMRLVASIIDMAHVLGLSVTAEGVETERQLVKLVEYLCDYIQGYVISQPRPPEDVLAFLESTAARVDLLSPWSRSQV